MRKKLYVRNKAVAIALSVGLAGTGMFPAVPAYAEENVSLDKEDQASDDLPEDQEQEEEKEPEKEEVKEEEKEENSDDEAPDQTPEEKEEDPDDGKEDPKEDEDPDPDGLNDPEDKEDEDPAETEDDDNDENGESNEEESSDDEKEDENKDAALDEIEEEEKEKKEEIAEAKTPVKEEVIPEKTVAVQALEDLDGSGTLDDPVEVPEDELLISGGVCSGVNEDWYTQVKDALGLETVYLKIVIPVNVTEIAKNAFYANKNIGTNGNNVYFGTRIAEVDFSGATSLEKIGYAAFSHQTNLTDVVDLSNTQVKVIDGSAFRNCNMEGVILPETLQSLGTSAEGGSSFTECGNLQYVKLATSGEGVFFELPQGIEYIGAYTFRSSFVQAVQVKIPDSVKTIGNSAFNSGNITQIIVEREDDFSGYGTYPFGASNSDQLVILKNSTSYQEMYKHLQSSYRKALTYPFTLKFQGTDIQQKKLYNQSIQYEEDGDTVFWSQNAAYELPALDESAGLPVGCTAKWQLNGDELKADSILTGITGDEATAIYNAIPQSPEVQFTKNGEIQSSGDFTVKLKGDQIQKIGVKVSHPLLKSEQGTDDNYVYFQYGWLDVKDSTYGPRNSEESELFGRYGTENEIPIRKLEDARPGWPDWYQVQIKGYYVSGNKTTLFFKKANSNGGVAYTLHPDVKNAAVYNITATAGTGGTISPEGEVSVYETDDQTFTITPDAGYEITNVKVDGEDKGAIGSYTFSNINEAHTIEASFSKIQYTLIFKPDNGENDIILTAEYGDQVPAPGVAKDGYVFAGWKVDGSDRIYAEGEAVPAENVTLTAQWKVKDTAGDNSGDNSGNNSSNDANNGNTNSGNNSNNGNNSNSSSTDGTSATSSSDGSDDSGQALSGQWSKLSDHEKHWNYTLSNGTLLKDGWYYLRNPYAAGDQSSNAWFYFDAEGDMQHGWYLDTKTNDWYMLNDKSDRTLGMMLNGWYNDDQDGKWYYLDPENGKMLVGWQKIDGQWYYFNAYTPKPTWTYDGSVWIFNGSDERPYGSMYAEEITPDGYQVDASGKWIH